MAELYDVIIIGGGPAGLTAGLYCARARLKTLLLEKALLGGQIINAERVDNYPGFPNGISGFDLTQLMQQQAVKYDLEIAYAEVTRIENKDKHQKVISTNDGNYQCKALIIAGGAEHNHLGVPGEEEFTGRGISYCATCDGAFYRNQVVAIIGGGDSALVEAISLTRFASKVYLIHRRDQLRASKILQEQAFANGKIEFIWDTIVESIVGDVKVQKLQLRNVRTQQQSLQEVAAIFISIGLHPNTKYLKDVLSLSTDGYIISNEEMETHIHGIFAVGDIRQSSARQVIVAAGDGATAAVYVERYIAGM